MFFCLDDADRWEDFYKADQAFEKEMAELEEWNDLQSLEETLCCLSAKDETVVEL